MVIFKKICLLGDGAVGKTSLIKRFVYDVFSDDYISTIGTKVTKKQVKTKGGKKMNLLIWDILGQKRYEDIHSSYYRGASGAFVVFDLTKQETFINTAAWIKGFKKKVGETPIMLLGNKSDLVDHMAVREETIKEKVSELGACYFKTSAKTGENVENAFQTMTDIVTGN